MLWIRSLDSSESRIIPGTEAATEVFWSPDSRSLGFFTTDRLWRIDVAGGPAQQVCPVAIPMGGGSWSRSGVIVFSPRPEGVLYKVPATGGIPEPATALDRSRGESIHRSPEFLPDGNHFLYVAMKEADIERILERAKEKYPEAKPRMISDNGPQFLITPQDMLLGRQVEIHAERDRKLEQARRQQQLRRQQGQRFQDSPTATTMTSPEETEAGAAGMQPC